MAVDVRDPLLSNWQQGVLFSKELLTPAKHGDKFLHEILFPKSGKRISTSLKTAKMFRFKTDFPLQGAVDEVQGCRFIFG